MKPEKCKSGFHYSFDFLCSLCLKMYSVQLQSNNIKMIKDIEDLVNRSFKILKQRC